MSEPLPKEYEANLSASNAELLDQALSHPPLSDPSTAEDACMAGEERRFKHKQRGTEYTLIGNGKVQCSPSGLLDDENVVIYRGDDGSLWARRYAEFWDGRFEEVTSTADPRPDLLEALREAREALVYYSKAEAYGRRLILNVEVMYDRGIKARQALAKINEVMGEAG
jgi:hypothetical protein